MKRGETGLCGMIAIDKPAGMTSHDVIDRVRRIYGERRCGHVGTLDPAATGLLIVAVGPATRLCPYLTNHRKRYLARIAFGTSTDTDDAQGQVVDTAPVPENLTNEDEARQLLFGFTGQQMQTPPAYSAIKQGGTKGYEAARAGKALDLAARDITVYAAVLLATGLQDVDESTEAAPVPYWDVMFDVSKGTYIRALARDIGHAAHTCAHLASLCRVSIGKSAVQDAHALQSLEDIPFEQACLDASELLGYPVYGLSSEDTKKVASGGKLSLDLGFEGETVSLMSNGRLLALYERNDACYKPKVVIPGGVYCGSR